MEILPVSTSNNTAVGDLQDSLRIKLVQTGNSMNPDSGTTVEYQRTLLASLDVSVLDKPHFRLENLSRRFIHESNPDDAGNLRRNYLRSSTVRFITTYSYSCFKVTLSASKIKVIKKAQNRQSQITSSMFE
ncbi:hypothetical protein Tco_1561331 [Tanacetum coccineum]